uniref:Uncharacterized protein n=1 Tax=Arundo donax TaxID=35708 RepID=A0A0A9GES0_ARUDO
MKCHGRKSSTIERAESTCTSKHLIKTGMNVQFISLISSFVVLGSSNQLITGCIVDP